MNNSEGQTQEPVGGMLEIAKTILLSIDHYREAGRDDSFNVQSIADYLKRCFSAPPSPVGIDVEVLARDYATGQCLPRSDEWFNRIDGFKAGYSASLPQSSTEEEKELWEEVANVLYGFEMGRRFDINELLSTYKISKR